MSPRRGRARRAEPYAVISIRLAPGTADALRRVAADAGVSVSDAVSEATIRAFARRDGARVPRTPLGLEPGPPVNIEAGPRIDKISVTMSRSLLVRIEATGEATSTVAASAIARMLRDLNYLWPD